MKKLLIIAVLISTLAAVRLPAETRKRPTGNTRLENKIKLLTKKVESMRIKLAVEKRRNKKLVEFCEQKGLAVDFKLQELSETRNPKKFTGIGIGQIGWIGDFEIFQILDGSNALVNIVTDSGSKQMVWLKGFSTSGWADGFRSSSACLGTITGSKQYNSNAGPKTVFVVEVFLIPKTDGKI